MEKLNSNYVNYLKGAFKLIGKPFLVNTNDITILTKEGERYVWKSIDIENLPYIPIVIEDIYVRQEKTNIEKKLILIPSYVLYSNGANITKSTNIEYVLSKKLICINNPFVTYTNYKINKDFFENENVNNNNIIKWDNNFKNTISNNINDLNTLNYIQTHQKQLDEFNNIYNQSLKSLEKSKVKCKKF